ncbi:hypothetical protein GCM10017673_58300 [Streptosporangium violaceochromogenes]|nr:hypothetical protein GCM10017673_58300 [Streptosporangium violaceochromogenes]
MYPKDGLREGQAATSIPGGDQARLAGGPPGRVTWLDVGAAEAAVVTGVREAATVRTRDHLIDSPLRLQVSVSFGCRGEA